MTYQINQNQIKLSNMVASCCYETYKDISLKLKTETKGVVIIDDVSKPD